MRRRRDTTGLSRVAWCDEIVPIVGAYLADLDEEGAVDENRRMLLPI